VECFRGDGGQCVLKPRCRLKARLAAAREAFMRELDATTLAECAYAGVLDQNRQSPVGKEEPESIVLVSP